MEQEQDEPTLIATTINAADFKRRIAERQPTSVSYVGLDARIEFAEFLKRRMLEPNASGLAAILVASSWLTGRKIYHLSNQVWAASSEHINVEDFSETHSIFFDLKNPSMWVKLNRPCSHPINADDARQTKNWLKLPDVLDICKALTNNQVGSVTGDELGTALAKLLCDLKLELNITRAQIQNMLPEMLIWREGHGCTAALITDIGDLSLKINLHYLSPNSRFVAPTSPRI